MQTASDTTVGGGGAHRLGYDITKMLKYLTEHNTAHIFRKKKDVTKLFYGQQ